MKVIIGKSPKLNKKMMAIFFDDEKIYKKVHFGDSNYEDYTTHHDETRKNAYIKRHQTRENFNNPYTAGSLSRWILWNKKDLIESIIDYKKKFSFE